MLRRAEPKDWPRIHEICCSTANVGASIDVARWPFFGELWTGPYRLLRPSWACVVEINGRVEGYLTGCPDSAAFERERAWRFTLPLFLKVLLGRFDWNTDAKRFLKRCIQLSEPPEHFFAAATHSLIAEKFPAHLHINLEASLRGTGMGRALIEQYRNELQKEAPQVSGIHLFCGASPVPFYERVGFKILEEIDYRPASGLKTVKIFAMGLLL